MKNLINDQNGEPSTMRVACLSVIATVLGTWSYISITNGAMQAIDPPTLALVVSAFGAKVMQKGKEINPAIEKEKI